MNKYCQGPKCHTYQTTDRKRGMKGDKYFQTRTMGRYGYGDNNFCTNICLGDWWGKHGTHVVDHIGRLHEAKILTKENAWKKDYTWRRDSTGLVIYNPKNLADRVKGMKNKSVSREQKILARKLYEQQFANN